MPQSTLYKLFRKYFNGTITQDESTLLKSWLSESPENSAIFEELKKVWQEKSSEPILVNSDALIDHIWQQGVGVQQRKINYYRDWTYISKIAAIFMIFVSVPFIVYKTVQQSIISKNATVELTEIVKQNPAGQKSKINLPDGSIVWLNGESSLTYSSNFGDSLRLINLKGEAFFDVIRNENKPFIVQCDNLSTTALGTSFNIQAYSDSETIKISLVSGKVLVENANSEYEDIVLSPNSEIVYNKQQNEIRQQEFKAEEVTSWKDGYLIFKNTDYHEMIGKLEKWYGIEIRTEGNPPQNWRLSTSYKDEVLVNILKNLRFGKEFNYELKKDKLTIIFNS